MKSLISRHWLTSLQPWLQKKWTWSSYRVWCIDVLFQVKHWIKATKKVQNKTQTNSERHCVWCLVPHLCFFFFFFQTKSKTWSQSFDACPIRSHRWNACSEHIQRKPLSRRGRTGSLDELEDFARSYNSRSRRAEFPDHGDYSPPRRRNRDDDVGWDPGSRLPLPRKRRGTWDGELASQPADYEDYDGAFLTHVMESKARGDRGAARPAEDSDTLSKGNGGNSSYSRSPSHRPDEEDPLPPYSECEAAHWYRTRGSVRTERLDSSESTMRVSSHTRPKQWMSPPAQEIDRRRNLVSYL